MKLGLLTDIHENVDFLRIALDTFAQEQVDQIVMIGDVFATGEQIEETCRLLTAANVVGVWGNHDYGMCVEPEADLLAKFPASVFQYMATLRPRLEVAGCHFAHVEPWLDPEQVADLWYFEGPPDEHGKLARIFNAVPHRLLFAGHYHKWLLVSPDGIRDWNGTSPIRLDAGRYFVVIGALCLGRFAILDTETSALVPFNLI